MDGSRSFEPHLCYIREVPYRIHFLRSEKRGRDDGLVVLVGGMETFYDCKWEGRTHRHLAPLKRGDRPRQIKAKISAEVEDEGGYD